MPQLVDTPPPKPPRRRYSDHMSMSLGDHFSEKKDENLLKRISQENVANNKPTYFSLPSKLTSYPLAECDDQDPLLQFDCLCKNESQIKNMTDKHLLRQHLMYQIIRSLDHKYENKVNIQCNYQKYKTNRNSFSQSKPFSLSSKDVNLRNLTVSSPLFQIHCMNQGLKKPSIYCHRRYHSDSSISYFNASVEDCVGSSGCNSFSSKYLKICNTLCYCCKTNNFIMKEVQCLKEINGKLWEHLCTVQNCLEALKKNTCKKSTEISVSGLLSSIYYAQKEKDNAMEERLKTAFAERDSALCELERITCVLSKNFEKTAANHFEGMKPDKRTSDLVDEIGSSHNLSSLLSCQKAFLAHLCKLKLTKQDSLSYDLKYILVERNNAVEKVKMLEEEIKGLKMCFDLWYLDNKHWELTLFDVLQQLIERDNIATKVDKSLTASDINYRRDFPEKYEISQYESSFTHQWNKHFTIVKSDESKVVQEEIALLKAALNEEKIKKEQAERKCIKLERLIHTLRDKLNGQNVGVPV